MSSIFSQNSINAVAALYKIVGLGDHFSMHQEIGAAALAAGLGQRLGAVMEEIYSKVCLSIEKCLESTEDHLEFEFQEKHCIILGSRVV